jgi:small subunit ribosomal protein S16
MATRIRLQRHGKKGNAIFHLVVADSRAKRDGKFIEKLGTYNPNTNPATININFESTLKWVGTGAEMTETARAILSYKGVLFKNHLLKGVTKGALTAEQVEAKFAAWEADKANKIQGKIDGLGKSADADKTARLKAEADANAAKAKAIEAKYTPEVEETPAEEVVAEEAPATEEVVAEEAPAAEEVVATEEAPVAEEAATEAPAEEAASEETEAEA